MTELVYDWGGGASETNPGREKRPGFGFDGRLDPIGPDLVTPQPWVRLLFA